MKTDQSQEPEIRNHTYDGIQEYDQKLPNWWLFTLYITMVFFVVYWVAYYQLKKAPMDEERLDPVLAQIEEKRMESMLAMLNNENLLAMSKDSSVVSDGEQTYNTVCLACHGPGLKGKNEGPQYIGLSLVDDEWKYGGEPKEIYEMIYNGTPNPAEAMAKGEIIMPGQGVLIGAEGAAKVTAYILNEKATL